MKSFVLTSTSPNGLQNPVYFDDFTIMVNHVKEEVRKDLIENEATYLTVIDFDQTLASEYEWFDRKYFDDTFVRIDPERLTVTAKTSQLTNYGLEFFGEKLPTTEKD